MRKTWVLLLLGLGLLLAACGGQTGGGGGGGGDGGSGGGGDGGGGGNTVTVSAPGMRAALYRVGGGTWQAPADPTNFSFTATGAYEVALVCNEFGQIRLQLFGATVSELNRVVSGCGGTEPDQISFSLSVDPGPFPSDNAFAMIWGKGFQGNCYPILGWPCTMNADAPAETAGTQDVVAFLVDMDLNLIAARKETLSIANGGNYTITFAAGDDSFTTATLPDFTAPAGMAKYWIVSGATSGGTVFLASKLREVAYYQLPFASVYAFQAFAVQESSEPYDELVYQETRAASDGPPPSVNLPSVLDVTVDGNPPQVGNLSLAADTLLFGLNLDWSVDSTQYTIQAVLSRGFLGSATTYTVPYLTSHTHFESTLPPSGTEVTARVYHLMANRTLSELLEGQTEPGLFPIGTPGVVLKSASRYDMTYTAP